ncbi:MAG TPA: hypothetical protein VK970_25225 [Candidatus Methylacidiphilales bacterium]|nr:hypothetical protein [Candidatus Methylacidiphilales bacterium]
MKSAAILAWVKRKPRRAAMVGMALVFLISAALIGWRVYSFLQSNLVSNMSVCDMAWSPDGKRLAIAEAESDMLCILNWESETYLEEKRFLYGRYPNSLSWSPDGNWIAGLSSWIDGFSLNIIDLRSGTAQIPLTPAVVHAFTWVPDANCNPRSQGNAPFVASLSTLKDQDMRVVWIRCNSSPPASPEFDFPVSVQKWLQIVGVPREAPLSLRGGVLRITTDDNYDPRRDTSYILTIRDFTVNMVTKEASETTVFRQHIPANGVRFASAGKIRISPTGTLIAVRNQSIPGKMHYDLWDVQQGNIVQTLELPLQPQQTGGKPLKIFSKKESFSSVAWSRDGKRFAGIFLLEDDKQRCDGCLLVWWDVTTGKVLATRREWMFNQDMLRLPSEPAEFDMPPCKSCWSPSLDKVAIYRFITVCPPWFLQYRCYRSVISVVAAPSEALK